MITIVKAFWYASPQKLAAYGAEGGFRLPRVGGFKLSGFPPSIEVALQSPANRRALEKAVGRLEKQLRKRDEVKPVQGVAQRKEPVTFFEYQGPSARVVSYAFYVAAVSGTTGVLLVGSAKNTIAAPKDHPGLYGSDDPMSAIWHLFESHGHQTAIEELAEVYTGITGRPPPTNYGQPVPGMIRHVHSRTLIENGIQLPYLPHTKGIALYAGMQPVEYIAELANPEGVENWVRLPAPFDRDLASVSTVVVGSPIWIEQVNPKPGIASEPEHDQ